MKDDAEFIGRAFVLMILALVAAAAFGAAVRIFLFVAGFGG